MGAPSKVRACALDGIPRVSTRHEPCALLHFRQLSHHSVWRPIQRSIARNGQLQRNAVAIQFHLVALLRVGAIRSCRSHVRTGLAARLKRDSHHVSRVRVTFHSATGRGAATDHRDGRSRQSIPITCFHVNLPWDLHPISKTLCPWHPSHASLQFPIVLRGKKPFAECKQITSRLQANSCGNLQLFICPAQLPPKKRLHAVALYLNSARSTASPIALYPQPSTPTISHLLHSMSKTPAESLRRITSPGRTIIAWPAPCPRPLPQQLSLRCLKFFHSPFRVR